MKRTLILTTFIAVIAVGIGVLYFAPQNTYTAVNGTTGTSEAGSTSLADMIDSVTHTATTAVKQVVDTVVAEADHDTAGELATNSATTPATTPTSAVTTPTPAMTTPTPVATTPASTNTYTNGRYATTVSYSVPEGGSEKITVTLAIVDDTVTSLNVVNQADKGESRKYQSRFSSAIDAYVIGEALDGLSVSRVGGASLTSRAFNKAVTEIQLQAEV